MINHITFGHPVKVKAKIYDIPKYDPKSILFDTIRYENAISMEVISGHDAYEIENHYGMGEGDKDKYHEYVVLHFEDGMTATFCNSTTDIFKV